MPVYEYLCPDHGIMNDLRSIADRDLPAVCPHCRTGVTRVTSAPRLTLMSSANRIAWERNERSAHEPRQARRNACGHTHRTGESCGADPAGGARDTLRRAATGTRPWMLGH